ncbi:hypothetical protein WA1_32355 [Scytonema hofmannii PCC 7110]|uniref:Uncharacterized protein n=1 Tax=Scytonema hofmannii PCC 7110 TaxID=128403 RepID=A0A139X3Y4_9CYAN|nr:hormogonium polysaccharide biosynthesis protein HpsA [Scytonema hofmannii]KYC39421.1 hypothetical protein WA1_32355 [Scytonema hofmannii PCC 7110]
MKRNSKLVKATRNFYQKLCSSSPLTIKEQSLWLLRAFLVTRKQSDWVNAGFVLPTVAMVALVVVLLTTAILFRSFERSKNASNVRVNEAVLNAAAPAIDRARAKIDALFEDPTLPRATPSDSALYDALKKEKYILGDEKRLKLGVDIDNHNSIVAPTNTTALENDETLKSAWKFAVDTDNNGKKDSYTLYAIYFRNPTRDTTTGKFNRKRNALEVRTPPETNEQCGNATGFASLVGNSSWYKLQSGNLGKSFFVYTVNVPITQAEYNNLPATASSSDPNEATKANSEPYKGNRGFVALEFQQDRSRIPLANNAVWFENDLEITPGVDLLLNGRIHTNGNLLVGGNPDATPDPIVRLRQVSSKHSCFYNQENGLVTVGGNVGTGNLGHTTDQLQVTVDLYRGFKKAVTTAQISNTNRSTNSAGGAAVGFNDAAFNQRIAAMLTSALGLCTTCTSTTVTNGQTFKQAVNNVNAYPAEVKSNVTARVKNADDVLYASSILTEEIQTYLQQRARRVPFVEVSNPTGVGANSGFTGFTSNIDPPEAWRKPLNSSNQFTNAVNISVTTTQLEATYPELQKKEGVQSNLGDRIFVGNNLPAKWAPNEPPNGTYVGSTEPQFINNVNWTRPTGTQAKQRWRNTQIQSVTDLGVSERNGFWEQKAAENPINPLDNVGGVRIVTGAGIYVDGTGNTANLLTGPFYPRGANSFLPDPSDPTPANSNDIPVWPDTMPMSSPKATETRKGDLLMRATAVYHYKIDSGIDQEPIACVSSYYDPTNTTTAKNKVNVDGGYGIDTAKGRSNNGVVYDYPTGGRTTFFALNKVRLQQQAKLVFANGRPVNPALQTALQKIGNNSVVPSSGLQYADYSAIDTALCAINILGGATPSPSPLTDKPNHGDIKEASFLDAREIKQVSQSSASDQYDLDIEERQPLEIRVTEINIGNLASRGINGTSEYLLPYSGIIYATRDDGLLDRSDTTANSALLSPTDFKLDPTRRPNGIRLINGSTLARNPSVNQNAYNAKEKGLILVSNLPAYIKGNFNLHRPNTTTNTEIEEFIEKESNTDFYDRQTRDDNFACRAGRTGCPSSGGDYWRPATIIADAMTLLSGTASNAGFIDGFRNEGDYDHNNNTGVPVDIATDVSRTSRLKNGFLENGFATTTQWWGANNIPITSLGSYTLNGVTPVQRRVDSHPLYVMEICRQALVSECDGSTPDKQWAMGFDIDGDGILSSTAQNYTIPLATGGTTTISLTERDIKAYQLGQAILAAKGSNASGADNILTNNELHWINNSGKFAKSGTPPLPSKTIRERLGSGDTGSQPALEPADRRYPRRIAFARDNNNTLVFTSSGSNKIYQPIGVGCPVYTGQYSNASDYLKNGCTYNSSPTVTSHYGLQENNALWFRATSSNTDPSDISSATYRSDQSLFYIPPSAGDGQPILVPVLQIHDAKNNPGNNIRTDNTNQLQDEFRDRWLKAANLDTSFNATFVVGNSPGRAVEDSAGLQNFVRFLENWNGRIAKITGSFIQLKRSSYATAPVAPLFKANRGANSANAATNTSKFDYSLDTYSGRNNDGLSPFYWAPTRQWGFDVGLLSEQPDLFAQRFTAPPSNRPNEFFREVGQDDPWVKALLCAGQASDKKGESGATYSNAVSSEYRPQECKPIPADP